MQTGNTITVLTDPSGARTHVAFTGESFDEALAAIEAARVRMSEHRGGGMVTAFVTDGITGDSLTMLVEMVEGSK